MKEALKFMICKIFSYSANVKLVYMVNMLSLTGFLKMFLKLVVYVNIFNVSIIMRG